MATRPWADQVYTKSLDLTLQEGRSFIAAWGGRMLYYSGLVEVGTFAELSTDNLTAREEIGELLYYSPIW